MGERPEFDDEEEAPRKGLFRRWLRIALLALAVFVLLPYLFLPLYRPAFVHPVSTLMMTRTLTGYDRQWVAFDDIAPVLVQSVLMSEDGQFCNHYGIDWREYKAVIEDALSGEKTRGASTIPMQTVKNLFLWNGRSYVRKVLELPLAVAADAFWSKERMMEIYLNIAQWGPETFGIEAAAREQFGVPASDLSRRQAALLAVSLPNPTGRQAAAPSAHMNRLADRVERLAARSGAYINCLYD
ncbi:biosynthetic peptidoglycan transglycosylase [Martelella radicis]|uniref:Biosynthetic peptidoglycan transglycosylase n=1 Tax=Martelella radicis TaxID=1397476 RepID=A0A7W6KJG7_9HYPH|nr:transglycosylase domain-containing protein [Martelella radicis]MBB4121043.1 monofunctional biosynthetic peptidoglycan transglycosylase [Martelella radicis]